MRAEAGESGAIYFTSAGAARLSDAVRGTSARLMSSLQVQFASFQSSFFHVKLRWSGRPGFSYFTSSPFADEASRSRRRHFSQVTGGDETFDLMLSANAPASCPRLPRWPVRRVALIRWLFRWLFLGPSLRSIRSSGPAANRPSWGLDPPLSPDPDFGFEPWICRHCEPAGGDFRGISW